MSDHLATAHPDETLRDVAYRMAEHGVTRMPVIARGPGREIVGVITLPAMLAGTCATSERSATASGSSRSPAPGRVSVRSLRSRNGG